MDESTDRAAEFEAVLGGLLRLSRDAGVEVEGAWNVTGDGAEYTVEITEVVRD